ncbi:hypothetical protein E8E14_011622 [Neopestalotiopsis sp. 37M]|nr:hypothetical protein E8E14_011622 [Neopestalotiopsis sp. 37M]
MSEQPNGAPVAGAPAAPAQQPETAAKSDTVAKDAKPAAPAKGQPAKGKDDNKAADASAGEKKLTGAELKAKAKADKAARRAQQKNTKEVAKAEAAVSSSPLQLGPAASEVKGKPKGKDAVAGTQGSRPVLVKAPPSSIITEQKIQIPDCFSHLSMAKRIPMTQADKDVHPVVLALGQQMATFAIDESITRLRATLLAFKKVIQSYTTPPGHTLARHFTPHVLNPQIEYLTACRPMCFSMGNAIRWLKLQVSKIDMDATEEDAKRDLCLAIDTFVAERITVAEEVVTEAGAKAIQEGEVVLTYGRSLGVERALLLAKASGTNFSVVVIDDHFEQPGQIMTKNLAVAGIDVSYSGGLGDLINRCKRATKVLVGAEAVFSNGAVYARQGTCDVALAAQELNLDVVVLCQTINITERVATDSLTYNEIDPERCQAASFRLLFDTIPDKYLHLLITELGIVQPRSAPDLLRKLEEFN